MCVTCPLRLQFWHMIFHLQYIQCWLCHRDAADRLAHKNWQALWQPLYWGRVGVHRVAQPETGEESGLMWHWALTIRFTLAWALILGGNACVHRRTGRITSLVEKIGCGSLWFIWFAPSGNERKSSRGQHQITMAVSLGLAKTKVR